MLKASNTFEFPSKFPNMHQDLNELNSEESRQQDPGFPE